MRRRNAHDDCEAHAGSGSALSWWPPCVSDDVLCGGVAGTPEQRIGALGHRRWRDIERGATPAGVGALSHFQSDAVYRVIRSGRT